MASVVLVVYHMWEFSSLTENRFRIRSLWIILWLRKIICGQRTLMSCKRSISMTSFSEENISRSSEPNEPGSSRVFRSFALKQLERSNSREASCLETLSPRFKHRQSIRISVLVIEVFEDSAMTVVWKLSWLALVSRCLIAALQIRNWISLSVLRRNSRLCTLANASVTLAMADAENGTGSNSTMLLDRYSHSGNIAGILAFHRGRSNDCSLTQP